MALEKKLNTQLTMERLTEQLKLNFAKKTDLPTKVSDLTNDSDFQTGTQVQTAINAKIASAYKPAGSKTAAELTNALLVAANEGFVYNMSEGFTTTADFIEGAGKTFPAGTDVAVVVDTPAADETPATYKFNVMAGFVDTSGLMDKVSSANAGNLVGMDANGNATNSGIAADDVVTKVAGGTTGNITTLTANGKIQDGGKAIGDLALRDTSATAGNVAKFDANGDPVDAGIAAANVLTTADIQDYTAQELSVMLGITEAEPSGE
jgi:hypothetical protein